MPSPTAPRLHALDGVRALAASLVVLHHLGATNAASSLAESGYRLAAALLGGGTAGGVELFFVLSGVVLARPYLRSKRPMNVTSYFSRRVKRLYPPFLIAWLLTGLTVYLTSKFPTWWTQSAILPSFQWQVWLQQIGIIYWGSTPYNFAWWSLGTEVAFYLIFPLSILLFRYVAENRTLPIPIFVLSILASSFAFVHPILSVAAFDKLIVYSSCFCGGLLLAAVDFAPAARRSLALAGIAWVICSVYFEVLNPHVGWGLLAFAVVSSASDHGTAAEKTLSRPLLVWLGERSYSLFLTHDTVIILTYLFISTFEKSRGVAYLLETRLLAIPLMVLAAMLLFHFVERRFAKNLVTADAFWPWSISRNSTSAHADSA
jgi:peptidoglycan/LPS O-acetylase OafA/YrhL